MASKFGALVLRAKSSLNPALRQDAQTAKPEGEIMGIYILLGGFLIFALIIAEIVIRQDRGRHHHGA